MPLTSSSLDTSRSNSVMINIARILRLAWLHKSKRKRVSGARSRCCTIEIPAYQGMSHPPGIFTLKLASTFAVFISLVAGTGEAATAGGRKVDDRGVRVGLRGTDVANQFSPLEAINSENVKQLGLAWHLDLLGQRTLQATPIEVEGVLYFSGTNGWVFAVDGRTGRSIWKFDPDLANHPSSSRGAIFGSNRGVAFWNGKIYVGTSDGRLVALDARTGRVLWSMQTLDEPGMQKVISSAPCVSTDGKVFIGQGGYDNTRGYVTAYDGSSGRRIWRFHTVPGNPAKGFENAAMEMAARTWSGEWWKQGGHGTAWESISYDTELNRVYFGTAAAERPDLPGVDKLFTASIVALDADRGNYVWHYQTNPRDTLEYDAASPIVLAELNIGGTLRKVLMQAPKNGFFYVIDRLSGKLVSAEKVGKATWAERIDLNSGRPVVSAEFRARGNAMEAWPSTFGVHNWQRISFNPQAGLVYIPTQKLAFSPGDEPDNGSGALLAWDPVAQNKRWEVSFKDSFWNGGVLSTGGNLVFHGTGRGHLSAYNAGTGEKLWEFYAGLGINAAPMTYAVGDVQYVAVLVGFGGTANSSKFADYGWRFNEQPRRLLAFALGKQKSLPADLPPRFNLRVVDVPSVVIDDELAYKGAGLYLEHRCGNCHGWDLENYASIAPDLRESRLAVSYEAFKSVLIDGALAAAGMPKFDHMSEDEMRAIHMFIRQRARSANHQ
jgi:quinohemoprotein ethanol dehydrogenase